MFYKLINIFILLFLFFNHIFFIHLKNINLLNSQSNLIFYKKNFLTNLNNNNFLKKRFKRKIIPKKNISVCFKLF